ncbi:von Willebrand factor type A domain-containing protein [Tindallia magadiensis]|uniref:von Willebrand factor type A domain-containing protein n=1 Tax=Tindallia magadiensis TaxID=69895 RepID=A0A1I3ACC1_9FIRM|nr:VWA domain-containing protein [Tindallia magadiensis]SFH47763.1 von Willebrand factor type A domain-containing protein [Tindallia magadiensis]
MMNNRQGYTLLELILVISLLMVVIIASFNFLSFGRTVHQKAVSEADIQSSLRLTAEHVNQAVRYTSAAFTVPKSSFQDAGFRDPGWTYLGVTADGQVVLDKPPENEGEPRKVTVLAEAYDDVHYEIEFIPNHDSDGNIQNNIVGFMIQGFKDGRLVSEMESSTSVKNAHQVEHRGGSLDPSVALAFSMHDRGSPEFVQVSPDAYITMVIDLSGSMNWNMSGTQTSNVPLSEQRLTILRNSALDMIDKLSSLGFDVYVSLVPFGTNANNPEPFRNINDDNELNEVINFINTMQSGQQGRGGWTNTGDGIRRAYHQMKTAEIDFLNDNPEKSLNDFTRHMMVLVDGQTNRETRIATSTDYVNLGWWLFPRWRYVITSHSLYYGDGNVDINNANIPGEYTSNIVNSVISRDVPSNDNTYIEAFANLNIRNDTYTDIEGEEKQKINTFVIGFSADPNDLLSLEDIGESLNGKRFEDNDNKRFIIAADADELDFAFGDFIEEVSSSLWSISGPRLH